MSPYETKASPEYLEFKSLLANHQVLMLRNCLVRTMGEHGMVEDELTVLLLGGEIKFHIYVDRHAHTLWLLGGHWIRKGEPSKAFMDQMNDYVREIKGGRDPFENV